MTAEEIRREALKNNGFTPSQWLAEIAAQLAEFNAMVREAMDAEKA